MTPAAMGQGRERKARLPPAKPGSRWPWACAYPRAGGLPGGCVGCPSATRSTHGPPVGVRGAGGPTPWAGGLPGVRAGAGGPTPEPVRLPGVRVGFRWAVPWAGCLPGGRAGAGGPTCGAMCVLGARGCAGWPAWWPACWCACPWFRGSKTLKFTQRHTPEPATVPPQAGQCVPFRHIEFNVQGQQ